MTPSLPTHVTVPDELLWQRVDDSVVLLDLRSGEYHALNESAGRMWVLLAETGDVRAVLNDLCSTYDADEGVLSEDLAGFVAELADGGLLKTTAQ
jgi:hypothetical protein